MLAIKQGRCRDIRSGELKVIKGWTDDIIKFTDGSQESFEVFNEYYEVVKANAD